VRRFRRNTDAVQKDYHSDIAVRRTLIRSLLSLLLLTTFVWGGCISCEQYFMWPGAKGCCAPDGHCKTKAPAEKDSGRECKQIAFDHQKSVDLHIDLPVFAITAFDLAPRTLVPLATWHGKDPVEPSPPDLQVLHSTFLI
jgi:hypothetical protein